MPEFFDAGDGEPPRWRFLDLFISILGLQALFVRADYSSLFASMWWSRLSSYFCDRLWPACFYRASSGISSVMPAVMSCQEALFVIDAMASVLGEKAREFPTLPSKARSKVLHAAANPRRLSTFNWQDDEQPPTPHAPPPPHRPCHVLFT